MPGTLKSFPCTGNGTSMLSKGKRHSNHSERESIVVSGSRRDSHFHKHSTDMLLLCQSLQDLTPRALMYTRHIMMSQEASRLE